MVLVTFILGYHALSARKEERRRTRLKDWTERWVGVVFGEEAPPAGSDLSPVAFEAILDVRERLQGEEAAELDRLLSESDAADRLLRGLRSCRLPARLEALEAIGRARLPATYYPTLHVMADRNPVVRAMAARALARTLARFPIESRSPGFTGTSWPQAALADALQGAGLPAGVVLEALMLLEDAAAGVVGRLLEAPRRRKASGLARQTQAALVRASLEVVGRLQLLDQADRAAGYVSDENPEIRASSLRALDRLGYVPESARGAVAEATVDRVEFVRIQAARAAYLLGPELAETRLWGLLGDGSWWVRRAAGQALLRLGSFGPAAMERAARGHPDRFGRHMAVQALLDERLIDAKAARRLREAA